jgi:FkbM family methyltransferase
VRFLGYKLRIVDVANFYILSRDIFSRRIYHFNSARPDPLILDCGSNIGMSVLYFKMVYPQARVVAFEPDPALFPVLQENVALNHLERVELIQAALSSKQGAVAFFSDGRYASCLAEHLPSDLPESWKRFEVPTVRLRDYLGQEVDLLKMNIEGAEWEALADSEDRLRQVREMVVEYHHLPGLPRTLHCILELLDRRGFAYLINDMDHETNPAVEPPFHLDDDSRYYLLIYGRRLP